MAAEPGSTVLASQSVGRARKAEIRGSHGAVSIKVGHIDTVHRAGETIQITDVAAGETHERFVVVP